MTVFCEAILVIWSFAASLNIMPGCPHVVKNDAIRSLVNTLHCFYLSLYLVMEQQPSSCVQDRQKMAVEKYSCDHYRQNRARAQNSVDQCFEHF